VNGPRRYRVVICRGPECGDRRNSEALFGTFQTALYARDCDQRVDIGWQACFGRCSQGPNVLVRLAPPTTQRFTVALAPVGAGSNAALYNGVREQDVIRIVDEHIVGGKIVRELIKRPGDPNKDGGETK
jgi:(2Fe-2S) ferredoxin